jgi:hypothetical protein
MTMHGMQAFSEDANSMRQLCPNEQCCVFVEARNSWLPYFLDEHISDQSHCVFLPSGESMVDFIGASESVDYDWPAVRPNPRKFAAPLCAVECYKSMSRSEICLFLSVRGLTRQAFSASFTAWLSR